MSSSSNKPHPRELELRWTGKGTPTPLSQKMVIGGIKESRWLLMETPSAGEWCAHAASRTMSPHNLYFHLSFQVLKTRAMMKVMDMCYNKCG